MYNLCGCNYKMLIKKIVEIADNKNRAKNIIKKSNSKNKKDKKFGYILEEELKKEDGRYRS